MDDDLRTRLSPLSPSPDVSGEIDAYDWLEAEPGLGAALELLEERMADRALEAEESSPAPAPTQPDVPPAVEIVVFPSRGFQDTLLDVLAETAEEYDSCLLISATLPYKHLIRKAEAAGVRLDGFRVIDMVSAVERNGFEDSGRVAYVSSPTLLEKAILLAFDAVRNAGEGRHCLIVDSMSTLGFYNRDVALEQFTHRLTSLVRMSDWGARFLMNDHPKNQDLLEQVAHLFDGVTAPRPMNGSSPTGPGVADGPASSTSGD